MRHLRRNPFFRCDFRRGDDRDVAKALRDRRKTVVSGEGPQIGQYVEYPFIRHLGISFTKVNESLTQL